MYQGDVASNGSSELQAIEWLPDPNPLSDTSTKPQSDEVHVEIVVAAPAETVTAGPVR